jgi:hypothetical protein
MMRPETLLAETKELPCGAQQRRAENLWHQSAALKID